MENYKWIEGFAIASKLYYKFGHLDIDAGTVTTTGFPIGDWLQWNRDNIGSLNIYDINDLTTMGMIWNKSLLGNHRNFISNYNRLKKYKRFDEKMDLSRIEEDDLREWAYELIEWRKMENNAFLTLREVDMLDELGFPWGDKFNKSRAQEESARKAKIEYLVDQLRQAYSNNTKVIYKERADTNRLKEKTENVKKNSEKIVIKRVEVPVKSTVWYDVLLDHYMTRQVVSDDTRSLYKAAIAKGKDIKVRELEFLCFLNGGTPGIADWLIRKKEYTDIPSLSVAITELKTWVETMNTLKAEVVWDNTQYTINGYCVASLVYKLLIDHKLLCTGDYDINNRTILDNIVKPYNELKKKSPIRFLGKVVTFKDEKNLVKLSDFQTLYNEKKELEAKENKLIKEKEKREEAERKAKLKEIHEESRHKQKELREKAKLQIKEGQEKETDMQQEREEKAEELVELHKLEQKKSKVGKSKNDIINFEVQGNINKAIANLKNYMIAYGYVPFFEGEAKDSEMNRIVKSLKFYDKQAFDKTTINRLEKYGFFFYNGPMSDEVHKLRIAYCKLMIATMHGHEYYSESETFRMLATSLLREKDDQMKQHIKIQMYTEANSTYKDLKEFKCIASSLEKLPETAELVKEMKKSIINRICAKRYSNKIS